MKFYRKEGKLKAGNRKRICTKRDRKTANVHNRRMNKEIVKCEIKQHLEK